MNFSLPRFERRVWLFFAFAVLAGLAQSAFQLYLNLYVLALGYDKDFMGIIRAIPSFMVLIFGLLLGTFSDRVSARHAMVIGSVGAGVANIIFLVTGWPTLMVVATIGGGLLNGLTLLSTAPLIMQISDDQTRTTLFSANFGLATLVGFFGNFFAGQLPNWLGANTTNAEAYRVTLLIGSLLMILSAVPIWLIKIPNSVSTSAPRPENFKALLTQLAQPLILKLIMPQLFIGFGAAILIPYLNVYFREKFNASNEALGFMFSLASIATGIAVLGSPLLAKALGKVRAIVFTQGASLFFMALIGFAPTFIIPAFAFVMRSALMNMGNPLYTAFSMEQAREDQRATVNSIQTMMWNIGWAVGPALSGFIQQRYGFTPLFTATIIFYIIGTAATWISFRHVESQTTSRLFQRWSGIRQTPK